MTGTILNDDAVSVGIDIDGPSVIEGTDDGSGATPGGQAILTVTRNSTIGAATVDLIADGISGGADPADPRR